MIQLYAILRNQQTLQLCIPNSNQKQAIQSLFKHICKKIKNQTSKLVRTLILQDYHIYYFQQDQFIFIIVTKVGNRLQRMQNYLRVVAQIFYENYDQRKFHIILARIIKQINRIQFQSKQKGIVLDEEETFLNQGSFVQYKQKFNDFIQKRNKQSKRVYITMSILFVAIFVLLMIFICKKWC